MEPEDIILRESTRKNNFMSGRHFIILALIWTFLVGFSFIRILQLQLTFEKESVLIEARNLFERDAGYFYWMSAWNSAPQPTARTLGKNVKASDVSSMDTLLQHYSMPALEAFEVIPHSNERFRHLTSLNPRNPANQPDEWERAALLKLAGGQKEYSTVEHLDNQHYLRYMGALPGDAGCVRCHTNGAGEKKAFNAGISLAIPLNTIHRLSGPQVLFAGFNHQLFWILGLGGLLFGWKRFQSARRREISLTNELFQIRSAVECAAEAIMIIDNTGRAVYINPAFTRLFGHSLESLKSGGVDILYADRELSGKISGAMVSGADQWEGEVLVLSGKGEQITTWCRCSRIIDGRGCHDGMGFLFSDITERKKKQEEFVQSEKLNATLELAGAACHEINQPLQTALGYCDLALMENECNQGDLSRTEAIHTVREQVLRVADIVKKLQCIARYRTASYVGKSRIVDLDEASR